MYVLISKVICSMKNQKGVSPLIATVLLLLVCMAVGVIIWQWITGFAGTSTTEATKTGNMLTGCTGASLTVDLTDVKPTWYSTSRLTKFVLRVGSARDLNNFRIITTYVDGSSDLNAQSLDINAGRQKLVSITAPAGSTTKPNRIKIESVECGISTDIIMSQIENG
jgi:hypothetical protein